MPNQATPTRYGAVAQLFHWVIAALIVTQFVLARMADDLPLGVHKLALLGAAQELRHDHADARDAAAGVAAQTSAAARCLAE